MVFRNFLGNDFFFRSDPRRSETVIYWYFGPFWPRALGNGPEWAKKTTKSLFPAGGGPTQKYFLPRKLQKTIPDSVGTSPPPQKCP